MKQGLGILILTSALAPFAAGFAGNDPAGAINTELGNSTAAAKEAYYSGLRALRKAQAYEAEAAKASAPEKSAKSREKALSSYKESIAPLIDAISIQPTLYQAWQCLGVADLRLGNFEDSASAYTKVLELRPNYPEATEGRAEAYLGLNMVDEAKSAYLALAGSSPKLADELMAVMHRWLNDHPRGAQDLSAAEVQAFAKWVNEGGVKASVTN